MPTYQYACTECGHAFEQVQSFNDDALTVCPVCSGRLRKVFNAVGVVFKGSGFYRTDSRAGSSSSLAGSDSSAGKGSEKGSGKGSGKAADTGAGTGSGTGAAASSSSSTGGSSSSSTGSSAS